MYNSETVSHLVIVCPVVSDIFGQMYGSTHKSTAIELVLPGLVQRFYSLSYMYTSGLCSAWRPVVYACRQSDLCDPCLSSD